VRSAGGGKPDLEDDRGTPAPSPSPLQLAGGLAKHGDRARDVLFGVRERHEELLVRLDDTAREKQIGQHIGYRYDVNLLPDYDRLTPYLKDYLEFMGWDDLNWLEDVHMGYEAGKPAIFDRNINGWVRIPKEMKLPDNQQDRDMLAREVWKETARGTPLNNVIDVHIARLRRKVDMDQGLKLIHTVRGVGFMLSEREP